MLGLGTLGEFPLGGGPTQAPAGSANLSWWAPYNEPVRFLRDPRANIASINQFFTTGPPQVSFLWYNWLSDPIRIKLGLLSSQQQFSAFYPAPSPFVATGWFNWLSEPVRPKPRLMAGLNEFLERISFIPVSFTAKLDVTERGDIFLSVLYQFNRARRALVSIFKK
jgi:hypothetical protein